MRLHRVSLRGLVWAVIGIYVLCCSAPSGDAQVKPIVPSAKDTQSLSQDARLNFLAMRLNKPFLDDQNVMKYFILMNNCGGPPGIQAALNSEFDFPQLSTFYKAHADEILGNVPNSISQDVGPFNLGDYDMGKKSFPFIAPVAGFGGKPTRQPVVAEGLGYRYSNISPRCGDSPSDVWFGPRPALASVHISFPKLTFTDFPVDEATARNYVAQVSNSHTSVRTVFFRVEIDILNNPARATNYGRAVDFDGKVTRITVYSSSNNQTAGSPLGVIYP